MKNIILSVDFSKIPDSRVTLDGSIENASKFCQYNVVRSAFHDFYNRFYAEYKKYNTTYQPHLLRVYKVLDTCKFYYGDFVFNLEYNDGCVFFKCDHNSFVLKLCDFLDFTPELFVDFVLYESRTNEYKDFIIQKSSL